MNRVVVRRTLGWDVMGTSTLDKCTVCAAIRSCFLKSRHKSNGINLFDVTLSSDMLRASVSLHEELNNNAK